MYGLNDAARQFYHSVKEAMVELGCYHSKYDPALFIKEMACPIHDSPCWNELFDKLVMDPLRKTFLDGKLEEGSFGYVMFKISQGSLSTVHVFCLSRMGMCTK